MIYSKKNGYRNKYGLSRAEQKEVNKIEREKNISRSTDNFETPFKIFGLVLCLLLVVAIIRNVLGAEPVYFSSFMEMISNSPSVNLMVSIKDLTITADWGLFNFVRDFFNIFGSMFSILTFVFTGLLNLVIYLFYFIQFLFVV